MRLRHYTMTLIELAEEGGLTWETIAREALDYLSESAVADLAHCAGWVDDNDDTDTDDTDTDDTDTDDPGTDDPGTVGDDQN